MKKWWIFVSLMVVQPCLAGSYLGVFYPHAGSDGFTGLAVGAFSKNHDFSGVMLLGMVNEFDGRTRLVTLDPGSVVTTTNGASRSLQLGLYSQSDATADSMSGQIGAINRAERGRVLQVGLMNLSQEARHSSQLGIINHATSTGMSLAVGALNTASGEGQQFEGAAMGMINNHETVKGGRVGWGNLAQTVTTWGDVGLVNYCSARMSGTQIGLLNHAGTLDGIQIGLLNSATKVTAKGMQIGVLNHVADHMFEDDRPTITFGFSTVFGPWR